MKPYFDDFEIAPDFDELILLNIMGNLKGNDYINFSSTSKKYRAEFYDKYRIDIDIFENDEIVSMKNIKYLVMYYVHGHMSVYYLQYRINNIRKMWALILGKKFTPIIDHAKEYDALWEEFEHVKETLYEHLKKYGHHMTIITLIQR